MDVSRLTAEGRDGSVDGLDEDTFPVQLNSNKHQHRTHHRRNIKHQP